MADNLPIREGQILTGVLFNEPMRVETIRPNGPNTVIAGLVGTKTERFRSVTLSHEQIQQLTILDTASTYNGDGSLYDSVFKHTRSASLTSLILTSGSPFPASIRCRTNSKPFTITSSKPRAFGFF